MQICRNVEFYSEILPATSAIATYTPGRREGSNYTARGSEFFNGEGLLRRGSVEDSARRPAQHHRPGITTTPREAPGTAITTHHSPGRRRGYRAGHCRDTVNFTMGF